MPTAFVMARYLSLSILAAYAVQAIVTLAVSALVVWTWHRRDQSRAIKNAILVLCLSLASPYLQYYDLAIVALAPVWLLTGLPEKDPRRPAAFLTAGILLIAPVMGPALAQGTGLALGWILLVPALWVACRQGAGSQPLGAKSSRRPVQLKC